MFGDLGSALGGVAAIWTVILTVWKIRDDKRKALADAERARQQEIVDDHERRLINAQTKMLEMEQRHAAEMATLTERLENANLRIERLVMQEGELRGAVNAYSLCPSRECPYRNGRGFLLPDKYGPKPLE